MGLARTTRATLVAIAIAALAFGIAMFAHSAEQNDTEIVAVPFLPRYPAATRWHQLEYLGGLDIPRMGKNIGGLSGLRWDAETGRLLAITDDARWVWMTPIEEDGRLTGIAEFEVGDLLGLDGEILTGKEAGDSESLTRGPGGGWLVGFERDHRVWFYRDLSENPEATDIQPETLLGELADNKGLETIATFNGSWIGCAETLPKSARTNCVRLGIAGRSESFSAGTTPTINRLNAVPTDADIALDGTVYVLFRSYDPASGNAIVILPIEPDLEEGKELILFSGSSKVNGGEDLSFTVDNFEGLAVREERGRTFLYIVSDDNFSSNQRTLLMKFEVLPEAD